MPDENPFRTSAEASAAPKSPPTPRPRAWQPLTPEGAAAFALASPARLFLAELITALLAIASIVWFLNVAWFPVIFGAIRHLPDQGSIEHGVLRTPHTTPDPLAENTFLAVAVDVNARSNPGSGPDLYAKFNRTHLQLCSFLGCVTLPYPIDTAFYFNRLDLEPRWGAWKPFLLGSGTAIGVCVLFLVWSVMALAYTPIVRLLGFFRDKQIGFGACWKLSSATLLPGSCFLTIAIMLYGLELIGLIPFCILFLLHFAVPWIYLFLSAKALPDILPPTSENPFVPSEAE